MPYFIARRTWTCFRIRNDPLIHNTDLIHLNKQRKYFFYYQDAVTSNKNRVNIFEEFINTLNDGTSYMVLYETPFEHEVINQRVGNLMIWLLI